MNCIAEGEDGSGGMHGSRKKCFFFPCFVPKRVNLNTVKCCMRKHSRKKVVRGVILYR